MRLCNRGWSKQCGEIVTVDIINIVNTIWDCKNQARFHDKKVKFQNAINRICANISILLVILPSLWLRSMQKFQLLKAFSIKVHPPNAPQIKEVYWYPLKAYWIKCDTDGIALGCLQLAACGDLFRDSSATTYSRLLR
jgi:hypothetical protein